MSYLIIKNHLAPKCTENDKIDLNNKSHMFMWSRCNFRCAFCMQSAFDFNERDGYHDLTEDEFISVILKLMKSGKNFKFSGGEPTLNPRLEWELRVVKDLGGTVFLDTNGSNCEKIKNLLDKGLIDVLAVSLKGLSAEECMKISEIKNRKLCWDNVFKSIEYGSNTAGVKVIITHVCYNNVNYEELEAFSNLIREYKNVYYKINNLHKTTHRLKDLTRVDTNELLNLLEQLLEKNPYWKNHIIYVDNDDGITDYNKIVFM